MALEFHHEVAVANTLGRIENSMSLLESVAMEGLNLCNPMPNHHTLYDSANYPTKPSDRYQHRPITIKAIGGGVLQPQSQYLSNSNNNSRTASPHNQNTSAVGGQNSAMQSRRARESSRSAPGAARNRSSSNNRSGTPVWDRLIKESVARDAELAKRRNAAEAFRVMNEVDNCTFKPSTNNNTMAPATKEGETYDRLYNDAQRKEKKRLETLKIVEAKREKERESNMKVRRSSEDHTNVGKFWDRLYVKPEKAAQRTESPRKQPQHNSKPAKKISPDAILRLYNTAASKEDRRQQLVKRFEEEREGKLQRAIVSDRKHSIHHHQPPAPDASTRGQNNNNGKRVPSPPRSSKAVTGPSAAPLSQPQQYYTVPQPAVPHVARPTVPQGPVPIASNSSNHVAAHIDQLKATSSDYEEPSFNPETDDEPPKEKSNSPDLQQIMAAENSDDFEANEKVADARANAPTPPPRAAMASMDEDDDDFDLLTPIDASNPAPPANQPTHTLPKLNLDKALLGTAH